MDRKREYFASFEEDAEVLSRTKRVCDEACRGELQERKPLLWKRLREELSTSGEESDPSDTRNKRARSDTYSCAEPLVCVDDFRGVVQASLERPPEAFKGQQFKRASLEDMIRGARAMLRVVEGDVPGWVSERLKAAVHKLIMEDRRLQQLRFDQELSALRVEFANLRPHAPHWLH